MLPVNFKKKPSPVLESKGKLNSPIINRDSVTKDKTWEFSFRYWKQPDLFGLDRVEPSWMVSLLERLQELSTTKIEQLLRDHAHKQSIRYHEIDWSHQGTPLGRSDFTWLDARYLGNVEEFPFIQVHISKAKGRIVGFWDENWIFNILLVDPRHNIQPSKYSSYQLRESPPCNNENMVILSKVMDCILRCKPNRAECPITSLIDGQITYPESEVVIFHSVSEDLLNKMSQVFQAGVANSPSEILDYGVNELFKE